MKLTLSANAKQKISFENRFVRLVKGNVLISVNGLGQFDVKEGELIEFDEAVTSATIQNPLNSEQLTEWRVTPVKIGGNREFKVSSGAVEITNFPAVQAIEEQNPLTEIAVNNLPLVQGVQEQNPLTEIAVNNFPAVQEVKQKIKAGIIGLPQLNFDVNAKSIAANVNRKEIIIQADDNNVGAIWVGSNVTAKGHKLTAGSVTVLEVNGVIDVFADNVNDKLNLSEVV